MIDGCVDNRAAFEAAMFSALPHCATAALSPSKLVSAAKEGTLLVMDTPNATELHLCSEGVHRRQS
jgi:hypothetical protein